jgi:hypothetical protein
MKHLLFAQVCHLPGIATFDLTLNRRVHDRSVAHGYAKPCQHCMLELLLDDVHVAYFLL